MCSLYELSCSTLTLVKELGLKKSLREYSKDLIRPNDAGLTITSKDTKLINWGLRVSWTKKLLINARYETLDKKRSFRPILHNRCLIPATAYFEWRPVGNKKFKNRIEQLNQGIMTFAGLYSDERFIIITCPSANIIAHIHHRMPLIVAPHEREDWLVSSSSPAKIVESLTSSSYQNLIYNENALMPKQPDLFDGNKPSRG